MSNADFSLRKIAVPAFGPSVLFGIGSGAILPVIALSARELNASLAVSGLIVALIGLGSLVSNIPAALITSRYGERRSLIGASAFCVLALILCLLARHTWVLGVAVLMFGMATSVFYLARQTYLIEAVPIAMRARAMSTLGGTQRIGMFVGPFAAAALMHFIGLAGAYWIAIFALIAAGWLSSTVPDFEVKKQQDGSQTDKPKMAKIACTHAKVFATLGAGVLFIGAMRASRQIAIPLWADNIGLTPTTTAIIFGLVSAIDMLFFYPAGKVMDKYGRLWVALPCALLLGGSLMAIPLTGSLTTFLMVSMLMGLGNGIGSGIVMTLGADASPPVGRTEFLGIWRLIADVGTSGGPFLLSGFTALISLGAGIAATGVLGLAAAAVFWRWLPHIKASTN
jgi:MFS family permease